MTQLELIEEIEKMNEKEEFEKMTERFTDDRELFIWNEVLRIFYEAEDYALKLEVLKVLAAQH